MEAIGFYIFYGLNWIITLLPLRVLYFFSDILFLILYYFPSYRKKVVMENLRNSFPEKSNEELSVIARKFYRHFADLFVEILKLTHLSRKELQKRFTINNPDLVNKLCSAGHDVIVVHSHYNNWEWVGVSFPFFARYECISVYKPLQNKQFDNFLNGLRTKTNSGLAQMNHVLKKIIENRSMDIRALYGFISDQTPAKPDIRYYTKFLNQDTPVFLGIEKIAAKYDMSVVFLNVQKIKRGYYNMTIELLFEQTKGLPDYLVTETHVKRLEELIRDKPEFWLWTHRRWKYKKEAFNDKNCDSNS
ncbi:MAG: lysophospholipid acyltransferase family protein [Bacteroidota bacterium]|nr:lysophospholipid acyltransferase family protein [Bacteroidota bacterium]